MEELEKAIIRAQTRAIKERNRDASASILKLVRIYLEGGRLDRADKLRREAAEIQKRVVISSSN
jgi:hypothetical protein